MFRLALWHRLKLVESPLRLAQRDWPVPDYSMVCRRHKTLQVQIGYRPSAQSLPLLVDSTEIQFLGEGEWERRKHGPGYRREGRTMHLGIDAEMMEIRAIEVTSNAITQRGAEAVITPRKNSSLWHRAGPGAGFRN